MRAWKFQQAVFDLTILPRGVWIITPPPDPNAKQSPNMFDAPGTGAHLATTWQLLGGSMFADNTLTGEQAGKMIRYTLHPSDGTSISCDVDAATLTPRLYILRDSAGAERFRLALDKYAIVQTILWPQRMIAQSQQGSITIEFHDIEPNGDLPDGAFDPPARARKMP